METKNIIRSSIPYICMALAWNDLYHWGGGGGGVSFNIIYAAIHVQYKNLFNIK